MLSNLRIIVKQCLRENATLETYVYFRHAIRLGRQPVSAYFLVSVLVQNCLLCMRGGEGIPNVATTRFDCAMPSIREYLGVIEVNVAKRVNGDSSSEEVSEFSEFSDFD